jgi:CRISPR/Cas system-associated endonuclease/helicase Cas3
MLDQERAAGKTHTFVEEEISEAALPALGWRAEGKAERPVMVRGGVIADQVGYGKTIISLAYVSAQPEDWLGDKVGGRFFVDRLETAMSALRSQVEALVRNGDSQGALANMAKLQEEAVRNAEGKRDVHKTANFGKRMKGQAYRDRYEADPKKKKKSAKAAAEEVDLWEASESEDEVSRVYT